MAISCAEYKSRLADLKISIDKVAKSNQPRQDITAYLDELRTIFISIDDDLSAKLDLISFSPQAITEFARGEDWKYAFSKGLSETVVLINLALSILEDKDKSKEKDRNNTINKKIFIVHGRDEKGYKESIARFIERLGYEAVILHEQPNQGQLIQEKLESNSNVVYVIVLLTPDDIGGLYRDKEQRLRARQNVIFEFGYFIGKLGRNRVCAIIKDNIELPSDIDGLVYINYDDNGLWKYKITNELIALGLDADANLLFTRR